MLFWIFCKEIPLSLLVILLSFSNSFKIITIITTFMKEVNRFAILDKIFSKKFFRHAIAVEKQIEKGSYLINGDRELYL